jgi:hypothetical protein
MSYAEEILKKHPELLELVEMGLLTLATREPGPLPERHPIPGYSLEKMLTDLDEDRADRI